MIKKHKSIKRSYIARLYGQIVLVVCQTVHVNCYSNIQNISLFYYFVETKTQQLQADQLCDVTSLQMTLEERGCFISLKSSFLSSSVLASFSLVSETK
ncbi:hypothetical protein LDENG_00277200 [Lucifuga dentata]|nr:hypothetical protein LDENG_00277200 [Lucifuga dentata]